jgi:hypothetical protein
LLLKDFDHAVLVVFELQVVDGLVKLDCLLSGTYGVQLE